MKYEVGNTYGSGRPKGSPNKTTAETKELINDLVFNREEFTSDWKHMNAHERMEIRIKLAKFIIPEPKEAPLSRVEQDYPLFIDTICWVCFPLLKISLFLQQETVRFRTILL